MHQTYELYFEDEDGGLRFEPLTCPGDVHVLSIVKERMLEVGARSVEVRQFGAVLFTLDL